MRIVEEISHPIFKISIFLASERYSIKIEKGRYAVTYKMGLGEGITNAKSVLNESFYQAQGSIFRQMELAQRESARSNQEDEEEYDEIL